MKAGFAEIDITPPEGTLKVGWLRKVVGTRILDPLHARAAVFDDGARAIGFIQLDLLSIRWTQTDRIRTRIRSALGVADLPIMVAATHNHAGPAIANIGDVPRDDAYLERLEAACEQVFVDAWNRREPVEIGLGHDIETGLAFNRRMLMRDGTVKTQVRLTPESLCPEGPADPEVGLLAVRNLRGAMLGCIVNFTCHPVHHGGDDVFSAGYPGVLAARMKARGCPVTLFLNGASANIIYNDPFTPGVSHSKETLGQRLADRVTLMLSELDWKSETLPLGAASRTLELPFRDPTEDEVKGTVHGAQRFVDPAIYDRGMPALCDKIKARGHAKAEVQTLFMGNYAWAAIPAEYFVEHGLRIKAETYPTHTWVVGHANGMLGYVPTRRAFIGGGYETTFAGSSRMGPETGDLLADAAIELINAGRK